MNLKEIEQTLATYLAYDEVREDLLKMIEEYADEAYWEGHGAGYDQGWEDNDLH